MNVSLNKMNTVLKSSQQGFTLLEVLIAIAIFSVVSLASFTIFDKISKTTESDTSSPVPLLLDSKSLSLIAANINLKVDTLIVSLDFIALSKSFLNLFLNNFNP